MARVSVYYLDMRSRDQLLASPPAPDLLLMEARVKQFALNRFLYTLVGGSWQWTDRLNWSDQQWRDYAEADSLRTWVAYSQGSPAGYFELQQQAANEVEICYFGLSPPFIGKKIGGFLLTQALESAWNWGTTSRVLVNTCSLDHPSALSNYQARGMQLYRTEVKTR
jgi:GNAT superfamily N-acetyltransferase